MKRPLTVYLKRRKRRWTKADLERLHTKWLEMIDRYDRVLSLPREWQLFYKVYAMSGMAIEDQLLELQRITNERWTRYRYEKIARIISRKLKDKN